MAEKIGIDFPAVMARKQRIVTRLSKGIESYLFKKNKITLFKGEGRLEGPRTVVVKGEKARRRALHEERDAGHGLAAPQPARHHPRRQGHRDLRRHPGAQGDPQEPGRDRGGRGGHRVRVDLRPLRRPR